MKLVGSFFRALFGVVLLASSAHADPPAPQVTEPRPKNGYFSEGSPRWFVAARPELGIVYTKPYVSAGYGMPHWIWAGVDVNGIVTNEMAQAYGGVRAATPVLDVAFGVRDTWSYTKRLPTPRSSFTKGALYDPSRPRSRYWAWELEAVGAVPLPHAAIAANFILVRTLDVPRGAYVYEESYRAIVAKPLFATFRVLAVARLLHEDSLKIGALFEHVFETGRPGGVVRLGPAFSLQVTDHLEAFAALTFPLKSPDRLGLALGCYGLAGVRYRWATGESRPAWPWNEPFIP